MYLFLVAVASCTFSSCTDYSSCERSRETGREHIWFSLSGTAMMAPLLCTPPSPVLTQRKTLFTLVAATAAAVLLAVRPGVPSWCSGPSVSTGSPAPGNVQESHDIYFFVEIFGDSTEIHGNLWRSTETPQSMRSPWPSMNLHSCPWISIHSHGAPCTSTEIN